MGIHDRDYYRAGTRRYFDLWGRSAATIWIIIATCAAFVLDLLSRDLGGNAVHEFAIYDFRAVRNGEVWRLITPLFLHAGLFHLACNLLVLYWTGSVLEEVYGSREFLFIYFGAGLFSGLAEFLLQLFEIVPPSRGLGASGAVTAVLVLYALHFPHQRVLLFFVIPMPVWLLVVVFVGLDVLGAFGAGREGIGYIAHLAGALFGLLYFRSGMRLSSFLSRRRDRKAAPRLRLVPFDEEMPVTSQPVGTATAEPQVRHVAAGDDQLEARVDRVLDKVSKQGQDSLSAEERELLFQASERYKKRRK